MHLILVIYLFVKEQQRERDYISLIFGRMREAKKQKWRTTVIEVIDDHHLISPQGKPIQMQVGSSSADLRIVFCCLVVDGENTIKYEMVEFMAVVASCLFLGQVLWFTYRLAPRGYYGYYYIFTVAFNFFFLCLFLSLSLNM